MPKKIYLVVIDGYIENAYTTQKQANEMAKKLNGVVNVTLLYSKSKN
jgi:nitrate reductase NapAB chaperone NapD